MARDRPLGPVLGWDGEHAYCRASTLLRFETDPSKMSPGARVVFRRLFATQVSYRLEVGVTGQTNLQPDRASRKLAGQAVALRVVADGQSVNLGSSGLQLARRLWTATSTHDSQKDGTAEYGRSFMSSGLPMVLIERSGSDTVATLQSEAVMWPTLNSRIPVLTIVRGNETSPQQYRQVRGSLRRLHTELQVLREIARWWRADRSVFDLTRLGEFLAPAVNRLARERREGLRQPPLVALSASLGAFDSLEISDLADELRSEFRGIARSLDIMLERSSNARPLISQGDLHLKIENFTVNQGDTLTTNNSISQGDNSYVNFGSQGDTRIQNVSVTYQGILPVELFQQLMDEYTRVSQATASSDLAINRKELEASASHPGKLATALKKSADVAGTLGSIGLPLLELIQKAQAVLAGA